MFRNLIVGVFFFSVITVYTQPNQQKIDSLREIFNTSEGVAKLELAEPLLEVLSVNTARTTLPMIYELEQLAKQYDKDKELMISWIMIGWAYQSKFEFDSLQAISHKGIELAQQAENDTLLAKFYNAVGISHEKVGVLDSAEYFYRLALETDPRLTMGIYNNLGLAYIRKSDFGKAMEYLELALEEAQEEGNIHAEAIILNNIGMSHNNLNNPQKAKSYALRALELKEQLGDERGKLFPMVQLCSIDLPPEEHKQYVEEALKQAQKVKYPAFERLFTAKLAEVWDREGKHEAALKMLYPVYQKSLEAKSYDQNEVIRILGNIYINLKQYNKAEEVSLEIKALAESKNALDELQHARNLLMRIYRAQGRFEESLSIAIDFYETKDSLNQKLNLDKLAVVDAQLEDIEKEKEIVALNSELEQKEIRRKWMIAVGALLALIFSLIIYFRNRRISAQKAMIFHEKETASQLEVMNEKLKGLDQMKNRLFTNITHEFRTPLTVILGMAEQLETTLANSIGEKTRRKIKLIRRNGRSLLNLINQMLDLSKIENNQLKINYVQRDILPYIRYITESFHSMANAQNVLLKVESKEPEIIMDYDPEKIRQILSNLLSNAMKYTPSGGKVVVTVASDEEKKQLQLAVRDTGAGIPAKDIPHIFNRFYQSDDTVAKSGGTGIGLALTKELVKLLDGDISVESELEKGTSFLLYLPITQQAVLKSDTSENAGETLTYEPVFSESNRAAVLPSISSADHFPTVLIVEDNPDVVEYLADCLGNEYQLEYAYNGRAGIEKALESIPDIIISDVMMPEKTGFELSEVLKNDERTSHIPIVLLTAKADVESRISGLSRGVDAYLSKPFHRGELLTVMAKLVELRAKLRARYANLSVKEIAPDEESQEAAFSMEATFLKKANSLIEDHIADPSFAVQEFCKALGMSYPVVHRKLAALTGRSPSLFIRIVRLNYAKQLLESTDQTISEVAYDAGFNDPKFFSRVFSKEFGQPPSTFRNAL